MVVSAIGDPLGEPLYDRRLIKVKDQGLRGKGDPQAAGQAASDIFAQTL